MGWTHTGWTPACTLASSPSPPHLAAVSETRSQISRESEERGINEGMKRAEGKQGRPAAELLRAARSAIVPRPRAAPVSHAIIVIGSQGRVPVIATCAG